MKNLWKFHKESTAQRPLRNTASLIGTGLCCDCLRPEGTPGANDFRGIREGILANAPEFLAKIHWVCYTEIMMDWREFSGKRICAAVSGGMDSMSLLHMLKSRAEECGFSLSAVHCEHGIRGKDSLEDARLVGKFVAIGTFRSFSFRRIVPPKPRGRASVWKRLRGISAIVPFNRCWIPERRIILRRRIISATRRRRFSSVFAGAPL